MNTTTIRVPTETRDILSEMAQQSGLSMQSIIERALELYRRQQMLAALNDAYAAVRNDQAAWNALEAERREWDVTLVDGLAEL